MSRCLKDRYHLHWCSNTVDGQIMINDSGVEFEYVFCDLNGVNLPGLNETKDVKHPNLFYVSSAEPRNRTENFINKSDIPSWIKDNL